MIIVGLLYSVSGCLFCDAGEWKKQSANFNTVHWLEELLLNYQKI